MRGRERGSGGVRRGDDGGEDRDPRAVVVELMGDFPDVKHRESGQGGRAGSRSIRVIPAAPSVSIPPQTRVRYRPRSS
jgi:hypothetical protein